MRTRRRLLHALAALAVTIPLSAAISAAPAEAVGPSLLPVTVTNNTGRGDAVYLYVIGVNLNTGRLGYVNQGGAFTPWPAGAIPPVPAPDVAIGGPGNGGATTINFPRGLSGRVYFSLGTKLKFFLTPDGLVQPAPWAGGDLNRDILFDWSEFTYNDAGLWLNSSQVDMFAVPHAVSVTGSGGFKKTGELINNGRDNVINGIRAQAGWGNTAYTRSDGTVLRVLSPGKAVEAGLLSANYLDSYITSAWNAYTGKTLTVVPFTDQPNTKYLGRTSGNVMNFTNTSGATVASFNKPSSASVFGCAGDLPAPNDLVVGPISRTLCAALNRGTLGTIDTQPSTNAADFYKNNPTNQYAKIIHANMADGKAYAFPFDDVGNFEALVNDGSPTSAGITLSPFGAGGPPPPPPPPTAVSLISDWNGKCIDVPAANFVDGAQLQAWACNGTNAQKWTFDGGALKSQNNKCMDVAGGSTANLAAIQLYTCNGTGAQQFVLTGASELRNPQSNRCVDIGGWDGSDGAKLIQWDCTGGANQKWHKG
ncbi:MAG: hypothetical protein QOE51_2476 [Actinoplanes sp.]|nr:hypothetical protein [Actinoplanes sp.]